MASAREVLRVATTAIALAMAGYHLYVVIVGVPSVFYFRGTHWLFALVLIFLWYPMLRRADGTTPVLARIVDLALVGVSLATIGYIFVNHDYVLDRFAYVDELRPADWVLGIAFIAITLEATRRVIGLALPLTALAFLAYAIFVQGLGDQIVDQMYLTTEGIFGIPINVSATYMVLFILFGAFVERSGTGKLFRDFSLAIAGSSAGGPAKVACVTSAMFGTISGSSTANVMTTGTFTIPMMKRTGYKPAFAGAVEAVASTGGQIMPPIMGAAAFVMAEFMAVSYLTVVKIALIPAVLYFVALFFAVHFEAKRTGIEGLPRADLPRLKTVMAVRGHQFLPMAVIVGVLIAGFSPPYAALWGLVSVIPTALLGRTTRADISWRTAFDAALVGVRNALSVAAACACAGIVIGVISLSGIGVEFTQFVIAFSQETMVLALVLTALAGILLGMGLPTTPAYIVQVALLVPALVKLGVAMEAAHLFAFYFAILSVITPPVAISLYAASGLSGAGLWDSGIAAVRLAATGYIIPFMFVYGPSLLLIGPWPAVVTTVATALAGVVCLAASLNGFLFRRTRLWERLVLFAAALILIKPGLATDLAGLALVTAVVLAQRAVKLRSVEP
jgi:TRAP transporter 4TM/12TM fusion protein